MRTRESLSVFAVEVKDISTTLLMYIGLVYMRLNAYNSIRGVNMNGYMNVKDVAEKWEISIRQVQFLCKNNRISGAIQVSRIWLIPINAKKPTKNKSEK